MLQLITMAASLLPTEKSRKPLVPENWLKLSFFLSYVYANT